MHDGKRVEDAEALECAADVIQKCMEYAEKYEHENTDEEVVVLEESSDESEIWDCETIVSTYSNLDNHPGKIGVPEARRKKKLAETIAGALSAPSNVISLKGKQNLPVDFLPHSKKSTTEKLKDESSLTTEPLKRKQVGQESKEEKKERKVSCCLYFLFFYCSSYSVWHTRIFCLDTQLLLWSVTFGFDWFLVKH